MQPRVPSSVALSALAVGIAALLLPPSAAARSALPDPTPPAPALAPPPARPLPAAVPPPPANPYIVTLSFSVIEALMTVGELNVEVAALDELGIAGFFGYGRDGGFVVYQGGGSLRGYPVGDFDNGLQVGMEILYVVRSDEALDSFGITATGHSLSAGPIFGYKLVTSVGFTFETQLGAHYILSFADAVDGEGRTVARPPAHPFLTVSINLNVGWSF